MKILVYTDGSECSDVAVKLAGKLAVATDSDIKVLYVSEIPLSIHARHVERAREKVEEWGLELPAVRELKRAEKILKGLGVLREPSEEHIVEELVFRESEKGGYSLHISGTHGETILKLREGNPAEEIIREAEGLRYHLVVIGANKELPSGLGRVSREVAEYVRLPVLVVRKDIKPKKILVCTDGSRQAEEAIRCAGYLAKALKAKMVLLSVAQPVEPERERLPEEKCLEKGKKMLKKIGVKAETKLKEGSATEEILREAKSGNYDLIVTGSRGLSKLKRLLMGHVSLNVLEKAETNVLIVRNCAFHKRK